MSNLTRRNLSIPSERLQEQLLVRMADVEMASVMKSILGADPFRCVRPSNPPIATGMTDTMTRLNAIVSAKRVLLPEEYTQVPDLLRRLRYLLRVFYSGKTSGRRTAEFKYCDYKDIDDIGIDLHRIGLTLQYTPGRLRELFQYAPEMDKFLLDEPIDLGDLRKRAFVRERTVHADPESTDDDRMAAGEMEDLAQKDLAAYQMIYLMADLFVGWLLIAPADDVERRRVQRVMEKYVEYSTAPIYRYNDAFGDALTTCSRPMYTTDVLALRFAKAGGLSAMFEDWAVSIAKDGFVKSCLEKLTSSAWEGQSEASLFGVMRGLLKKIEAEGRDIATNPVFVTAIYEISSHYGHDVFQKGFNISHHEILFYFLHRRISRHPKSYRTKQSIRSLLKRYVRVARTTSQRYLWTVLPVAARWDCIGFYGCGNTDCPEKKALYELSEKRQRGVRDPVVEERLFRWGGLSKACSSCKQVSYCSVECQKVHWRVHKATCKKDTPKDQADVELEI